MARTKETARKSTGGRAPRMHFSTRFARREMSRAEAAAEKVEKMAKIRLSNKQMASWLRLNRLISQNRTTNEILKDALRNLIESRSIEEIFLFIAKGAKYENDKMELIHESISKQITKHENKKKDKKKIEDKNKKKIEDKDENRKLNVFELIPNECISHICGYINKKDIIKSLKHTSRRQAIVCFNEMNKSTFGTINFNVMSNLCNLHDFNIKKLTINNRYPSSTKYYSLYDDWHRKYNIPPQNQLLFNISAEDGLTFDALKMETSQIGIGQEFLILDNRKITILSKDKQRKFNIEQDKYENIKNYELMILEYFDIKKQTFNVVQYILYEGVGTMSCQRLFDYIQHKFVPMDGIDNDWYDRLQNDLQQMKYGTLARKLMIYQHEGLAHRKRKHKINTMALVSNDKLYGLDIEMSIKYDVFGSRLFTLQPNYNPSWSEKQNKFDHHHFDDIILKCGQNMDKFYLNADMFCNDIIYISVHFKGDTNSLQSIIKQKYESKEDIDLDLDEVLENIGRKCFKIKMSKTEKSDVLRQKISKILFNDIIDGQHIELSDITNSKRMDLDKVIGEVDNVYYSVVL